MISSKIISKRSRFFLLTICLLLCSWVVFAKNNFLNSLKGTQAKEFSYINYDEASGNALWRLNGESPTFLEDSTISVKNPILLFYANNGEANIKAQKAIISGNAKHCEMLGQVKAQYLTTQEVNTEHAYIDLSTQTVTFPGPFQAQNGKSSLNANRGKLNIKPYQIITYGPSELDYIP